MTRHALLLAGALLVLALSTAPLVPFALADGSVTIQEVDEQGNPIGKDAAPRATQG